MFRAPMIHHAIIQYNHPWSVGTWRLRSGLKLQDKSTPPSAARRCPSRMRSKTAARAGLQDSAEHAAVALGATTPPCGHAMAVRAGDPDEKIEPAQIPQAHDIGDGLGHLLRHSPGLAVGRTRNALSGRANRSTLMSAPLLRYCIGGAGRHTLADKEVSQ